MNLKTLIIACILVTMTAATANSQDLKKLNLSLVKMINEPGAAAGNQINLLVKGNVNALKAFVENVEGEFRYNYGDISSVIIPVNKVAELSGKSWAKRIASPMNNYVALNDTMRSLNNVNAVHQGAAPLTQSLKGKNVIMGILDTGVDFTHPDLQDSTGQTRILHLWDQTLSTAPNTPQPFGYGQEWTGPEINIGLASAHNDIPYFGHGTHVSGIAAGNALANGTNMGVAPESDLIEVAFNFNDNTHFTYADGVNYIFTKASQEGKPCVINASLGDYYGSHDGQDLESQMISNMINQQPGRVMVAAAGNSGTIEFHLGYQVTSDTSWTWLVHNSAYPVLYLQIWADTADFNNVDYTIGADANTTSASFSGQLPFTSMSNHLGIFTADTLFSPFGNRIGIIQGFGSIQGSAYLMEYVIMPDSTSYLWRLTTTGSGKFDMWKFLDGTGQSGFVTSPLPPSSVVPDIVNYMLPDANQTIVSGFQCLENVIAVGNFGNRSEYIDVNGSTYSSPTTTPGVIAGSSSWGPTRDGRIKPDISASGGIMLSCGELSLLNTWAGSAQANKVAQGGKHFRDGGTSSSSPVVAGIAALYLEKYPNATAMDVKNALLQCAIEDSITGFNLPDNVYGYGKLDGHATITNCGLTGISENSNVLNNLVHPNPVLKGNNVFVDLDGNEESLEVYDVTGRLLNNYKIPAGSTQYSISTESLVPGIYFLITLENGRAVSSYKLSVTMANY
jgi:subtilisin family serine protease